MAVNKNHHGSSTANSAKNNSATLTFLYVVKFYIEKGTIKDLGACHMYRMMYFSTGPNEKATKLIVFPWPFIPSGKPYNISLTFTPGELM